MDKADHERLTDIRNDMVDLLEEAKNLIRKDANKSIYERAKATWIGDIDVGLGGGNFMDNHAHTFEKTLNELDPGDEDEDDDNDETDEATNED